MEAISITKDKITVTAGLKKEGKSTDANTTTAGNILECEQPRRYQYIQSG
jgi:hypothetical protein